MGLAYPCGVVPGFDPTHPASPYTKVTCVASGGNLIDLQSGAPGAIAFGIPTQSIDGIIGVNTNFSGSTARVTFTGRPTTNWGSVTIAVIFTIQTFNTSSQNMFVVTSSLSGGFGLGYSQTSGLLAGLIESVANKNTTLQLALNTPYFAAMSVNSTTGIDYILTNLRNGSIVTTTTTSGTPINPSATSLFGTKGSNGQIKGGLSAAMWSSQYTPPAILKMWAADPWRFWYPGMDS